jgi:plasmid stability protein
MNATKKSSPTLTIRKLDPRVVQALKARAQRAGRSMEEEVRVILTETTLKSTESLLAEFARVRALNGPGPFDSVALVREIRDEAAARAGFAGRVDVDDEA